MKKRLWLLLTAVVAGLNCFPAYAQQHLSNYAELREGFADPPPGARPKAYWWWLNGNVDTVRMKEELKAMKKAGIAGVDIFEIGVPRTDSMIPAGPAFMSAASLKTIQLAVAEAGRLKMEAGLNLASSWNAGGRWTSPAHAAKSLYYSDTLVHGSGTRQKIILPFPVIAPKDRYGNPLITYRANGRPAYYEDVAVLAMPAHFPAGTLDTAAIINLTPVFDSGREVLSWDMPPGEWRICRYVCANSGQQLVLPSPNSRGPIIDHFDAAAVRSHLMYFIRHLQPLLGDFRRSALKSLYLASYEAKGSVWTPSLPAVFKRTCGYEVYKFIPALFDQNLFGPQTAAGFRADFQRTLSELMINNLYRNARQVSNAYGLKINSEAGGPAQPLHNVPVEPLKALGALDIPRGEFWNRYTYYNEDSIDIMRVVKEVSAAAHIYHRGIVEEESFTSFRHWQEGPFDLKPIADRAFCEGMNRVVMHGFSHSPSGTGYPGYVYHAGTHFNDKNPWWPKIRPFIDYLGRVSYLLQRSGFVADVLYYYGDSIPNYVAPKNTRFTVGKGYDYEVINTDILLKLTVRDGQLMLPGGSGFKVLALGNIAAIRPAVLEKIAQLARAGALITGPRPERTLGLSDWSEAEKKIQKIAAQLWDTKTRSLQGKAGGNGKILAGLSALDILQQLGIPPDLAYPAEASSALDYIHTRQDDLDLYFIRNTTDQWVAEYCAFRQQDKLPEIWDPLSGTVVPVTIYKQDKQQMKLPLTLPPYGSCFIVFSKQQHRIGHDHYDTIISTNRQPPLIAYTKDGPEFLEAGTYTLSGAEGQRQFINNIGITPVTGSWTLTFPKGWGAPDSASFPELISWTVAKDKGIRYFSGMATYHKIFNYHYDTTALKDHRLYLDLGRLSEVAEVWLNGRSLGICWAQPYRLDITGSLKEGKNTLTIEVANTWSNRLTGDALTGEKYTNTNIRFSSENITWANTPLIPSGLMGPVLILDRKVLH